MLSTIKKISVFVALLSVTVGAFADRGIGKKAKSKTILNINTNSNTTLKSSIAANIKAGLTYKGSLVTNTTFSNSTITKTTLVTYQKGNTTYIIPYKQKIAVNEMRQGYTGVKLILRRPIK